MKRRASQLYIRISSALDVVRLVICFSLSLHKCSQSPLPAATDRRPRPLLPTLTWKKTLWPTISNIHQYPLINHQSDQQARRHSSGRYSQRLLAPQNGAHSRGAFRDFHPILNPPLSILACLYRSI